MQRREEKDLVIRKGVELIGKNSKKTTEEIIRSMLKDTRIKLKLTKLSERMFELVVSKRVTFVRFVKSLNEWRHTTKIIQNLSKWFGCVDNATLNYIGGA